MMPRDREVLDYIVAHQEQFGVMPTLDEIGAGIGVASKGAICRRIDRLERMGYVARPRERRARALRILKLPQAAPTPTGRQQQLERALQFAEEVIRRAGYWSSTCDAVIGGALRP